MTASLSARFFSWLNSLQNSLHTLFLQYQKMSTAVANDIPVKDAKKSQQKMRKRNKKKSNKQRQEEEAKRKAVRNR